MILHESQDTVFPRGTSVQPAAERETFFNLPMVREHSFKINLFRIAIIRTDFSESVFFSPF